MSIRKKLARWLLQHVLLGIGLVPLICAAENLRVLVVLSDNSAPYLTFSKTFSQNLPAAIQVTVLEQLPGSSPDVPQADLIVAVGMKASEFAAAKSVTPMLAAMIPRTGYEGLFDKQRRAKEISAIYLDQPWNRQLDFLRAALPEQRRIGLLYSPDMNIGIAGLQQKIADRGGVLIAQPVRSAGVLFPSLEDILANSDILLAIPDSRIYSSSNIRNILLTSYRRGVPLVGFSQAYVNAGALAAIFTTPEQLAEQTSATVISFAKLKQLPEPQYPAIFTIALNLQVARSLGIDLNSAEAIRKIMDKTTGEGR
ncbi:MAG: hypothetical protein HYZ46_09695 [Nitrosomonadales bacterium]|nr:hypothetical protein [Nitrosomonadales bacterium]